MGTNIIDNFNRNNIIKLHFISKLPFKDIAIQVGLPRRVIKQIITDSGRVPFKLNGWTYGAIALKCAIGLYIYGIGIRGVSKRLDIPIGKLTGEFKRQGVKIRTQSEQDTIKWSLMTSSQRLNQVKSANAARIGMKVSHKSLIRKANSIEKSKNITISPYETIINEFIISRGYSTIIQKAVSKYNIDIFVNPNIAVEIFGGGWHFHGNHLSSFTERTKEIFNSGNSLIVVHITAKSCIATIRSNLMLIIDFLSTNKPVIGKYWVVWGTGNSISFGGLDNIDVALVRPSSNKLNLAL